MTDLRRFLLENIHWYKPCAYQKILLTGHQLSHLFSFLPSLNKPDGRICGIDVQRINSAADRKVVLSIPDDIPDNEDLPVPSKAIYTGARLGLIGSSLVKTIAAGKGRHFQNQGNVDKHAMLNTCRKYYEQVLDYHRPAKVIARLRWGFELTFLYTAARRKIPCVGLLLKTRKYNPPLHWDKNSRWMYAFLTEQYDKLELVNSDTTHSCRLDLIDACDVCVFHNAVPKLSDQMSFTQRTAQSRNKLTLDISNDWLDYIEDS